MRPRPASAMTTKALASLTSLTRSSLNSTKRSCFVTALVCAAFIFICFSRLNAPASYLFARPGFTPAAKSTEASAYDGPRFDIFGIPDWASSIEVATLNIKIKEDKPKSKSGDASRPLKLPISPPGSGSPSLFSHTFTKADDALNTRRDDATSSSLSPFQHQLPIALPHFHPHRLDAPAFNLSDLENPPPGIPPATISLDLGINSNNKPPDASSLTFGVATTLDRMPETLRSFRHWAANTGARFVVLHEPHNTTLRPGEPTAAEVVAMYAAAGIDHVTMVSRDAGWGERFVGLLGATHSLMEAEPSQAKWAVLIDDDTFFFDLGVVIDRLNKYDHRREWYVGALSENKWNINNGGLFAVGGAGVFVSKGLLDVVAPHAKGCYPDEPTEAGGDALVGECIHRWTTTKLTIEHGLRQLDIHGDPSGFYEAAREQPVSVHHWKSWHHVDMPNVAAVSAKCGRGCVLQNYKFQDGWQMSNGYSIVRYAYNETYLAALHPQAMERTWKNTIWDVEDSWTYSLAPLKARDEGKVQYLNEKTVVDDDGTVTVFYVRRENGVGRALIRVVWR